MGAENLSSGDVLAAGLARATPGAASAAWLEELEFGALSDAGRIDALVALHRHQGWLQAKELELLADLEDRPLVCIPGRPDALVDFQETREQVACALHVSPDTAGARLVDARRLVAGFPETVAALGAGRVHFMQAKVLAELTRPFGDNVELAREVEARVLPKMPAQTVSATRKAVERAVLRVDPEGAERRHAAAKAERCTFVAPEPEGMALFGARLAAEDAARVSAAVDTRAREAEEDDPRTMGQRRADALVELVTRPEAELVQKIATTSRSGASRGRVGTVVQVTVPYTTLIGVEEAPGELKGYGPIAAAQARALAFGPDSVWYRLLVEPSTGRLVKTDPTAYRPTAELERHVIARDTVCRFPGCCRPADRSDLHHVVAFDHAQPERGGHTDERNMIPLCRRHHLTVHRAGWRIAFDPATGEVTWTAPTGHTYSSQAYNYPVGGGTAAGSRRCSPSEPRPMVVGAA